LIRRFVALLTLAALFGAPAAQAQTCTDHALFRKGTVLTVSHFNAKGKELGQQTSITESTAPIDGGVRAEIRTTSTMKGAPKDEVRFTSTCSGDTITVDMRTFMGAQPTQGYEGWEISFEGSDLAYPVSMSAGQTLPDTMMTMVMKMPGAEGAPPGLPTTTRFEVEVTNRKVVGQESVTTAAGTFDAWKVTFDVNFEMKGMLSVKNQSSQVEWYVPGIGTVKSETWRKGKLEGRTELAALQKGA